MFGIPQLSNSVMANWRTMHDCWVEESQPLSGKLQWLLWEASDQVTALIMVANLNKHKKVYKHTQYCVDYTPYVEIRKRTNTKPQKIHTTSKSNVDMFVILKLNISVMAKLRTKQDRWLEEGPHQLIDNLQWLLCEAFDRVAVLVVGRDTRK